MAVLVDGDGGGGSAVAESPLADPFLINPELVTDVVSSRGYNVGRLCEVLDLKPAEFAKLVDRGTESVARAVRNDAFVHPEHEKTLTVVMQLVELVGLTRTLEMNAGTWLRTPLPSYEGTTPLDLFRRGKGRELIARLFGLAVGDVGG